MADKPSSLRKLFHRGRTKSTDQGDMSDSNSDSSWAKSDSNSGEGIPVQPAQSMESSPRARLPKKLQKKRTNSDNSPYLTRSGASSFNDVSPGSAVSLSSAVTETRRDVRRNERRQHAPTGAATSRESLESVGGVRLSNDASLGPFASNSTSLSNTSYAQPQKADQTFLGQQRYHQKHGFVEPPRQESDDEGQTEDGLPQRIQSEQSAVPAVGRREIDAPSLPTITISPPDSDLELDIDIATLVNNISGQSSQQQTLPRRSASSRSSNKYDNAYLSPVSRIPVRSSSLTTRRTPSPVSPTQEQGVKSSSSPVSPLDENGNAASADEDAAPLLPHERMVLSVAGVPNSSPSRSSGSAQTGGDPQASPSTQDPPTLTQPQPQRLQKKKSRSGRKGGSQDDKQGQNDEILKMIHDATIAESALKKALKKRREKEEEEEDIPPATTEMLREAASMLDLGPRGLLPDTPRASLSPTSTLSPHTLTAPPVPVPSPASSAKVPPPGAFRPRSPAPGSDRVQHPRNVQYDKPFVLPGNILQRGFRRWRCCKCGSFTHYDNHICSNLGCVHSRCEGECEAFEPAM